VGGPIYLDDQSAIKRNEVDDVARNGMLPTKFPASESSTAKLAPKNVFGERLFFPQLAGTKLEAVHPLTRLARLQRVQPTSPCGRG
jgi:hypothetical protein